MLLRSSTCLVILGLLLAAHQAAASVQFADSVASYTSGTIAPGYDKAATAAVGAPDPQTGFGLLTPFNPPFSSDHVVAVGRGGSITLRFATPVAVIGSPQIGVFTTAGFSDADFPNGYTANPVTTFASAEYGYERSAIVEVAATPGDFKIVGRITFSIPTSYYANLSDPQQAAPPASPQYADFGKPFTKALTAFNGKDLAGILAVYDGSAGGTWITLPENIGISEISYVRLSDPLWIDGQNNTAISADSIYGGTKSADLYVDAVVLVPEPSTLLMLLIPAAAAAWRRRSKASAARQRHRAE